MTDLPLRARPRTVAAALLGLLALPGGIASAAEPTAAPAPSPPAAPSTPAPSGTAAPASTSDDRPSRGATEPATALPPEPVAIAPPAWETPSFSSDPLGAVSSATDLTLKMYGDTGFAVRNKDYQPWPTGTANPDVYAPGVWNSFFAPRIDLFGAADVGKLTFLTEVMFEGEGNTIGVDVERLQINYLFANWLRVRAGRSHLAWGYYNDTYHHGNLFELTTSRPFSVNFEDSLGIILSHNVGAGIDGTFELGSAGSFRYDAEIGNGRAADITAVDLQFAEKNEKSVNLRLRWTSLDGLIVGINGMRDVVPSLASSQPSVATRPNTEELVGGAHVVYMEDRFHIDVEAFAMRHNPIGGVSTNIFGGFAEFGYAFGAFTPYGRAEYMRFPPSGDIVYQYTADSAQGTLLGSGSVYSGVRDFTDLRVGIKWLALPQLALKLEGERIGRSTDGTIFSSTGHDQEIATVKAAFGFW